MPQMSSSIIAQSIQAASQNNWEQVVKLSEEILKNTPKDTDSLNRLAYAYLQMGYNARAKKIYKIVLKIDKYNQIAQKNLKRLTATKSDKSRKKPTPIIIGTPYSFLEEPGKTKIVNLCKLPSKNTLLKLKIGEKLFFKKRHRSLVAIDSNKTYLGVFPDDISLHLLDLCNKKFEYECIVKSVSLNSLQVFLREIKKPVKFREIISFPLKTKAEKIVIRDYRDTTTGDSDEESEENESENKENY